jgi:23S rRNA (guanosine2251-2'-O)-methyltransferase
MKGNRKRSSIKQKQIQRSTTTCPRIDWHSSPSMIFLCYGFMIQFAIFRVKGLQPYKFEKSNHAFRNMHTNIRPGRIYNCRLLHHPLSTYNNQNQRFRFTINSLERRYLCSIIDIQHGTDNSTAINTENIDVENDPITKIDSRTNEMDTSSHHTGVLYRRNVLRQKLLLLDCFTEEDVLEFDSIVKQSTMDPTASSSTVHHKFGKSTIKTCQTFYYPKNEGTQNRHNDPEWIHIAASRTARQIEFLYLRHKAQQTQWIRNHDSPMQVTTQIDTNISLIQDNSYSTPSQQQNKSRDHYPFIVVLDNLRSAQNVGSIYRTADATKCQQIITVGITPNPVNGNGVNKIHKSALGAELLVPSQHFHNASLALQYMYHTYPNYQLLLVETTSRSVLYTDYQYAITQVGSENIDQHGIILVFGNEVTGVDVSFYLNSKEYIDRTNIIEIPMYGQKNSLNVAVCVSIILYEMIRQFNLIKQ